MFRINTSHKATVALLAALLAIFASPMFVQALPTLVPPVIPDGSVWTPSGNPYIIGAYSELPSGDSLVIEPGVEVVIGRDVEFRINGTLTSIGTYSDPILFMGTSPSNYWERIYINYSGGEQSEFGYCNLSDAKTAIHLHVSGGDRILSADIHNCSFSNNVNHGVYGYSYGYYSQSYLNPSVRNCVFDGATYGCEFRTEWGHANPILAGNVFRDVSISAAVYSFIGVTYPCSPVVENNVISNCGLGIEILQNNYDVDIVNNIFVGCAVGISRISANSLDVHYNCFYGNSSDFVDYPPTYGDVVWWNDNGDPCDLFYNIFMDPQFEPGSFELSASSPCIDAGDLSIIDYFDPILGSSISDMGAYGGEEPGAGIPPSPPVIVTQPQSQSVFLGQDVTFDVEAVGYDLYYQWHFGDSELDGETTDTLTVTNASFEDAGNYYCAVSNVYDVVNSDLANLRVTEIGLEIAMHTGLHMTNLNIGTTYSIQYVDSLSNTNWTEITNFVAEADNDVWYDPEPANQQSKFYGVESQP